MPRIDDHLMETSMLFVVNGCLPPPAVQTFGWDAPNAPTINFETSWKRKVIQT
jgi:hypothetical protein